MKIFITICLQASKDLVYSLWADGKLRVLCDIWPPSPTPAAASATMLLESREGAAVSEPGGVDGSGDSDRPLSEQTVAAVEYMLSGQSVGKVVLRLR